MQKKSMSGFNMRLIYVALTALSGVLVAGCHGADDDAPTNTKNSQYMDKGDTAADKIGAQRAAGHRLRTGPDANTPSTGK